MRLTIVYLDVIQLKYVKRIKSSVLLLNSDLELSN